MYWSDVFTKSIGCWSSEVWPIQVCQNHRSPYFGLTQKETNPEQKGCLEAAKLSILRDSASPWLYLLLAVFAVHNFIWFYMNTGCSKLGWKSTICSISPKWYLLVFCRVPTGHSSTAVVKEKHSDRVEIYQGLNRMNFLNSNLYGFMDLDNVLLGIIKSCYLGKL